ncbi:hypothetical protein D3P06_03355 [Paracoccus aestuarii]|uniref:Uncharacterized protein n=1 Tax=Paracoccus aestuarii TaxID=453842 RepID=A0A419A0X4_9RHOB|nr:hypothetical protein D3P06_03355 [Paracoccus aestuarii]
MLGPDGRGPDRDRPAAFGGVPPQISLIALAWRGDWVFGPSCLIPRFDGVILSREWKEALWARFAMEAP